MSLGREICPPFCASYIFSAKPLIYWLAGAGEDQSFIYAISLPHDGW
jgi:hypothetical protein